MPDDDEQALALARSWWQAATSPSRRSTGRKALRVLCESGLAQACR